MIMKLKTLLLVPVMALLLTGCGGGGNPSNSEPVSQPGQSSGESQGGESRSEQSQGGQSSTQTSQGRTKDLLLRFYEDYNHYEEEEPYYEAWWYLGEPFTKEDIGLVDPKKAYDPYYPTFLGWSKFAIVDEDDKIFEFGKDVITYEETANNIIELFGIFVGK